MMGRKRSRQAWIDGVHRRSCLVPLGFEGEVDHHDGVLLHDANQQHDADQRHDAQLGVADHQREQRADAGRWKCGENGYRMDVTFVQYAKHDVHGDQRRHDQHRLVCKRGLERLSRALKRALDAGGESRVLARRLDRLDRVAEGNAWSDVKRECDHRELSLMVEGERCGPSVRCVKAASGTWPPPTVGRRAPGAVPVFSGTPALPLTLRGIDSIA